MVTFEKKKTTISHFRGFPGGAVVKSPPANARDTRDVGSITRSGISPGEGNGYPLQYSRLENPMDRGVWWTTVYGFTDSDMTECLSSRKNYLLNH